MNGSPTSPWRVATAHLRSLTADSRKAALQGAVDAAILARDPSAWVGVAYQAATDYGYDLLELAGACEMAVAARANVAKARRPLLGWQASEPKWLDPLLYPHNEHYVPGPGAEVYVASFQALAWLKQSLAPNGIPSATITFDSARIAIRAALDLYGHGPYEPGEDLTRAYRRGQELGLKGPAMAELIVTVQAPLYEEALRNLPRIEKDSANYDRAESEQWNLDARYRELRKVRGPLLEVLLVHKDRLPPELQELLEFLELGGGPGEPGNKSTVLRALARAIKALLRARGAWAP